MIGLFVIKIYGVSVKPHPNMKDERMNDNTIFNVFPQNLDSQEPEHALTMIREWELQEEYNNTKRENARHRLIRNKGK